MVFFWSILNIFLFKICLISENPSQKKNLQKKLCRSTFGTGIISCGSCQIKRLQMLRTILTPLQKKKRKNSCFFFFWGGGGGAYQNLDFFFCYLFWSLIIVHVNTYVRSTYRCVTVLSWNAQETTHFGPILNIRSVL